MPLKVGCTGYSDAELARLKERCPERAPGYVFFNNISMYEDALRFKFLFGAKGKRANL